MGMYGRIMRQRLRALIIGGGWTFRALALQLGWSGSTLQRKFFWRPEIADYESALTVEDVEAICVALGVPVEEVHRPQLLGDDRLVLERLIAVGVPVGLAALAPLIREKRRDYAPGEGPNLRACLARLIEDGVVESVPGGVVPVTAALPLVGLVGLAAPAARVAA